MSRLFLCLPFLAVLIGLSSTRANAVPVTVTALGSGLAVAQTAPSDADDDDTTTPAASTPSTPALAPAANGGPLNVKIGDQGIWVWPPKGIAGRPLIVSFHGSGWSGDKEMGGWINLARQHNFTMVCPDYVTTATVIQSEKGYLTDVIKWIKANLQYDQANVYMAGFSAGGLFTWWNGTEHPDFFHGLFFQSANFYGADISRWYNRPIKMVWGSEDIPHVIAQNVQAAAMLHDGHCKTWETEVIQGAHHQPHHDMVVAWMEQVMAPAAASSGQSSSGSMSDDGSSDEGSSGSPSSAQPSSGGSSSDKSATVTPQDDPN